MESTLTAYQGRRGFVLITVLIVTAIGLLFGSGALLLFRYQCQLRIDRQHELEKVYAVRSALNYIKSETIADPGRKLIYTAGRDRRNLGLIVKPAKTFFPLTNSVNRMEANRHFVMEWGDLLRNPVDGQREVGGYDSHLDYECGAEGVEDLSKTLKGQDDNVYGLIFDSQSATSDWVRCWVNIGMRSTGGWLQENYGRRYSFYPKQISESDVLRLWLIRDSSDANKSQGVRSFGWPVPNDAHPLMLEFKNGKDMVLYECNGDVPQRELCKISAAGDKYFGMQLAHNKASIFYIKNDADMAMKEYDTLLRGYNYSSVSTLSGPVYDYFSAGCKKEGERIVAAPDLRVVFDVKFLKGEKVQLQKFKVASGYQYDVMLEYPEGTTNLATVAQRVGEYSRGKITLFTILTYDTHGTEHMGFRYDERHPKGE